MLEQTLMRGGEHPLITLGCLSYCENSYTRPLSCPMVVYMVHMAKTNKDNAVADNRFSTYATSLILDPQLHLGLHFLSRLVMNAGAPLTEVEVDTEVW